MKNIKYLKFKRLWDNEDIQNTLDYLHEHTDAYDKVIDEIKAQDSYDCGALIYCIDSGWYEDFDRFDSDVAEQYIDIFKELILNKLF